MRIAVGQLWQETNTFNRQPTRWADFEHWGLVTGDDVLAEYGETGEIGGFVSAASELWPSVDWVGLARFACWPWGPVDEQTWQEIQHGFDEQLQAAGRVDAVFLALHGAMASADEPDLTGAILQRVRERVGPDVPIVGTLDLHANLTRRMVDQADLLVSYHTCPHLDAVTTGRRAALGLARLIESGRASQAIWCKLPMITPAERHDTFQGPPAPVYERLKELEAESEVLSAGVLMAMPWLDVPDLGWSVVLWAERMRARWREIVEELAQACWNLRDEMVDVERLPPEQVVAQALASGGHPVVVGDGADATNSGAPGDSTHLLRAMLEQPRIPHGGLVFVVDPDAVRVAVQAGVGGPFHAAVGGGFAPEYSPPVLLRGVVERILEVEFVLEGHIGHRLPIRMGRGAVIRSGDVSVLLVERSGPGSTPRLYETAGLDPRTAGIVVAKSPAGFRADYGSFASSILLADAPGCASPHLKTLNFVQVDRPLWPLEAIESPKHTGWCRPLRRKGR